MNKNPEEYWDNVPHPINSDVEEEKPLLHSTEDIVREEKAADDYND
jgi:hypothetical protein